MFYGRMNLYELATLMKMIPVVCAIITPQVIDGRFITRIRLIAQWNNLHCGRVDEFRISSHLKKVFVGVQVVIRIVSTPNQSKDK
jgi:hypothetical protein